MAAERLPSFFIIGAPKCGTTALFEYLATHPRIFLPAVKEPHYFNVDHSYHWVESFDAYKALFADAPAAATVIGEGSVWYLYSRAAVPEILKTVDDPRFVVMIRNPVDMFPSLHEQLIVSGREDIEDPEEAWNAQERRRRGIDVPKHCLEPLHLQYRDACALGTQLQRLLAVAPRERVHWILFDDFVKDTRGEYLKVLRFLGLDDDGRTSFPRINSAKGLRSRLLQKLVRTGRHLKRASRLPLHFGILARLKHANLNYRDRRPLSPAFRAELARAFSDEISRIEEVTGRDLSAWRHA
jgi:hypothetical protein